MTWISGSNNITTETELYSKIKNHINNKGKIAVGTDSMIVNRRFVFVTAVCLVEGDELSFKGRYFYKRKIIKDEKMKDISYRIFKETSDSIEIAERLNKVLEDQSKIEIHLDVNSCKKHLSNKYESSVSGYVNGCGYTSKIKPYSFAASAVADWHTRPNRNYVKKICP